MPSFAELKERAAKARDSGLHKFQDTRDKYSSRSSKDLDWDADHRRPSPTTGASPPSRPEVHSRNSSALGRPASGSAPPPPPPRHSPPFIPANNRPNIPAARLPSPTPQSPYAPRLPPRIEPPRKHGPPAEIDWANLSAADKEVFFSWLDEFFERRFNINIAPRQSAPSVQLSSRPLTPVKAPPVNMASRPSLPNKNSHSDSRSFVLSYPPPTIHGSAAADLASYFAPTTHWDSAWYASGELAPPLEHAPSPNWAASWSSRGSIKTIYAGILFSDLSICWYSVAFSTVSHADPNDTQTVVRSARYLPRPAPQNKDTLVSASETYGETIASFAESFEGTGQYCARGECWDLANEALKQFDQYDYIPKPVPSVHRTHGHLIFEGKAEGNGAVQLGRWRGDDDRIRRGDIVEWRSVRVGMGQHGYAMLGAPDHTAIIVSETVPRIPVGDGLPVKPSEVGILEVVEQSVGSPPKRQSYDLSQLQEGEIWVYRPIGMELYVGALLAAQCPEGVPAISI